MIKEYFIIKIISSDRWEKIKEQQKIDIKYGDKMNTMIVSIFYFLLQNPIDTSLNPLLERGEKYDEWITKTIYEIKKITKKKVRVRINPRFLKKFDKMKLLVNADEISDTYGGWNKSNGGESLYHDFRNVQVMCYIF